MTTAAKKPPYRIPSMKEIRAIPFNGLTVASTFSGCGGSCLGFRWAGFKHVYANEFTPAAQDSYRANFPDTYLDTRDIREVKPEDVMGAGKLKVGELDVFEGSPPCQSFSTAGKRAVGWGQIKDQGKNREDLFFEYARLLRGMMPKVFVAENVSGLVKGVAKGYFIEIMEELQRCGYRVRCKVLNAKWLGVPQDRSRTIFVGVRDDLSVDPPFPAPFPFVYSIRDAIPWIGGVEFKTGKRGAMSSGKGEGCFVTPEPTLTIGGKAGWGNGRKYSVDGPAPTLMKGGIAGVSMDQFEVRAPELPPSYKEKWEKLRPGESDPKRFNLVRSDADKPVQTIVKNPSGASVTHPFEPRRFSIAELRRLGGFPDDYVLVGTFTQQWERVGNSVPPPMMWEVAKVVRDEVLLPLSAGKKRARKA